MRLVVKILGVLIALGAMAFAVVWFVPSVQDWLIKTATTRGIAKANHLPFMEDDALHILLCGTGSPMPDLTRASACVAVIAGGQVVVIDSGPGSWEKIAATGVPPAKIDTVLLTHLHSDHIGDLGELANQTWMGGRKVPLEVYGPPKPDVSGLADDGHGQPFGAFGTEDVTAGFAAAYNADAAFRILHQGPDIVSPEGGRLIGHDIAKPGPDEAVTVYDRGGLTIEAFLVNHDPVEPAYGYRVSYGGRIAVISGDTVKVPNMVRFSKGADVLIHEALNHNLDEILATALEQNGRADQAKIARKIMDYHTAPTDAAAIAGEAGVKLLVFTHMVPPLRNALMRRMFLRGVKAQRGKGDTILGRGGLLITLPKGSDAIKTQPLL
jgi:ribonuclease Z